MIYELPDSYFVRTLQESDLSGPYPFWFEDQRVNQYNSHGKFPKTLFWFKDFLMSLNQEDRLVWALCHQEDGHIGNISLQELSFINRNAELAILIGDQRHQRKSVGFNAAYVLLKHGFLKLNLNRVYCATAASNKGMQKLALKLGMVEEGRRRNHLFLEGSWVDAVEYGILRHEFLQQEQVE